MQCLKTIIENTIEYNMPLILGFIDFITALNNVDTMDILKALKELAIFKYQVISIKTQQLL